MRFAHDLIPGCLFFRSSSCIQSYFTSEVDHYDMVDKVQFHCNSCLIISSESFGSTDAMDQKYGMLLFQGIVCKGSWTTDAQNS